MEESRKRREIQVNKDKIKMSMTDFRSNWKKKDRNGRGKKYQRTLESKYRRVIVRR